MAEGRQKDAWQRTSLIVANLLNGPCVKPDKKPWQPSEFNPFESDKRPDKPMVVEGDQFIDFILGR